MELAATIAILSASMKYIAGVAILLTIFALPEIILKIRWLVLKKKGYGMIKYYPVTNKVRTFIVPFNPGSIQLEPGLSVIIPADAKPVEDAGIPVLNYNYKDTLPLNMENALPDGITSPMMDAIMSQADAITTARLAKEDKKKEQMEKLLVYATPGLAVLTLWFIMQQNDKIDKLLSMAGVK